MAGRAWIKLYERWLTCPRHAELSGDTLGTGALLLLVAESMGADGEEGVRWLLGADGGPVTLATCHRHVRVRSESGQRRVRKLLGVGTMVERQDGCLGFSNYRQWQEKPGAARMRKHRDARHDGVTGDVTRDREAEAEEDAEAEAEKSVAAPKRRATKPSLSADACGIAQYLYDAIKGHTPGFAADVKPATIRTRLQGWARDIDVGMRNDGMTADGCRTAIDTAHRGIDDFWHRNLLSGKALRKQYERLRIQRSRKNGSNAAPNYDDIDFHGIADEMDRRWPLTK